ncbi:hypothetical protein M569_12362 [Genlisea aurea]|uniref:Mitochondrial import inner membrane translocase subunit TIM50 n=1 Tax=Genlisea aurea TaxID=192259 RepID=S8DRL8_9LAMI|nr:hypothetical protein M569_12362 [Genlisea aurea]
MSQDRSRKRDETEIEDCRITVSDDNCSAIGRRCDRIFEDPSSFQQKKRLKITETSSTADASEHKSNGAAGEIHESDSDRNAEEDTDLQPEETRNASSTDEKKLLVLDLNGLLIDISSYVPYDYDPDEIINRKAVFKRPHCDDFLKFCFEKFNVGIWSSRTKRNVEPILDYLLGNDKQKLAFIWDHSHCVDSGFSSLERRNKPLLVKKLKRLWESGGEFNETNTLLLDDTPHKALTNPEYNAIFPVSYRFTDVADNSLGAEGDLRVYLEGVAVAGNVQEYVKEHPFGQRPITENNLSWGFYRKVIEAVSTPPPSSS